MIPVPLSADLLTPYATLIAVDPARRLAYPAATEPGDVPGASVLSTSRAMPVQPPALVARLERHPHTSQTFLPLAVSRWLVVVMPALPDGSPDMTGVRAFVAGPGDAICLHRNVWHAPLMVLDRPADMAMLMWRAASGDDTLTFDLPAPIRLEL